MEFLIKRTRYWGEKPCKEAKPKKFVHIDWRTVKTLAEARKQDWGDEFFARGTNHREEKGMVARDLSPTARWVIEINTLEELIKLSDKYGDIILGYTDLYKGIEYELEIYDTYRE